MQEKVCIRTCRDEMFEPKKTDTNQCKIDHTFMTFISDKRPMGLKVHKNYTILINEQKKKMIFVGLQINHD